MKAAKHKTWVVDDPPGQTGSYHYFHVNCFVLIYTEKWERTDKMAWWVNNEIYSGYAYIKLTHQAPADKWSLVSLMVSVLYQLHVTTL